MDVIVGVAVGEGDVVCVGDGDSVNVGEVVCVGVLVGVMV